MEDADYIIVGGGLTGCALASRLHEHNSSLNVLILEASIDPPDPDRVRSAGAFELVGSDLDWSYSTVPQPATSNRIHTVNAGKTLGGGSTINFAGWARGDASDYDAWAEKVGDRRWSYEGLLPFFRRTERYFDPNADPKQHGFDGPMKITSVLASHPQRKYALREPVRAAWTELGVQFNSYRSNGSRLGILDRLENLDNGRRQPAHLAYSLKGIRVLTGALVHRVLFSKDEPGSPVASAVLLADGREFKARKEIILSAGTLRTPQILMLSGIGPIDQLSRYDISLVIDNPEVGQNVFDHFAHYQVWKLRHPEKGLALGSPLMAGPAFSKGLPSDWVVNEAVPQQLLQPALEQDVATKTNEMAASDSLLLCGNRCHIETLVIYCPVGIPLPMDGTYISTSIMLLLPTSRGSLSINSASPTDAPVINPKYYTTQADRISLIYGTRRTLEALLGTSIGNEYIEYEVAPPGHLALHPLSTDAEIDQRIRNTGKAHYHSTGSAAMGKVVAGNLCVYGVRGLRIADASVLPVPIGGHPQATLYGVAEQAAELILRDL